MSNNQSLEKLPVCVQVDSILSSRYPGNERPLSWDDRRDGIDTIRTKDQKTLRLLSDGGQSPPQPGWSILISEGDASQGYKWTLYGMPKNTQH